MLGLIRRGKGGGWYDSHTYLYSHTWLNGHAPLNGALDTPVGAPYCLFLSPRAVARRELRARACGWK